MEDLLESDKIKLEILKILADRKFYSFYNLSKQLKTNFSTIKKNCKFLELLGLVEIQEIKKEETATGKPRYYVRITDRGLEIVEKLNFSFVQ